MVPPAPLKVHAQASEHSSTQVQTWVSQIQAQVQAPAQVQAQAQVQVPAQAQAQAQVQAQVQVHTWAAASTYHELKCWGACERELGENWTSLKVVG